MLLRLVSDFRRAMDLSLVLDEEGIGHELRNAGEERWALIIADDDSARAEAAIVAMGLTRSNSSRNSVISLPRGTRKATT